MAALEVAGTKVRIQRFTRDECERLTYSLFMFAYVWRERALMLSRIVPLAKANIYSLRVFIGFLFFYSSGLI